VQALGLAQQVQTLQPLQVQVLAQQLVQVVEAGLQPRLAREVQPWANRPRGNQHRRTA
jgi:hypothetical protein